MTSRKNARKRPAARALNGTPESRLTREHWLTAALDALVSDGVENVKVLTLAERLGVSRSSFYWFFRSREHLLDLLLQRWRDGNTRAIVEQAGAPSRTVTEGVLNIFSCWMNEELFDHRLDFTVREWARRSGHVRRAVDQADDARVEAIKRMFLRHGYRDQDAFIRARVLYFMQIGYYSLDLEETLATRLTYVADYLRAFTGREPTRQEVATFTRSQGRKP
ncbi:MAG TPA: TetR/AcrR family transcriptional regulator [Dongiaceae bacterium]|jgi:AcrR family transcriptional regulator